MISVTVLSSTYISTAVVHVNLYQLCRSLSRYLPLLGRQGTLGTNGIDLYRPDVIPQARNQPF